MMTMIVMENDDDNGDVFLMISIRAFRSMADLMTLAFPDSTCKT
jgi:hypothetical protein